MVTDFRKKLFCAKSLSSQKIINTSVSHLTISVYVDHIKNVLPQIVDKNQHYNVCNKTKRHKNEKQHAYQRHKIGKHSILNY